MSIRKTQKSLLMLLFPLFLQGFLFLKSWVQTWGIDDINFGVLFITIFLFIFPCTRIVCSFSWQDDDHAVTIARDVGKLPEFCFAERARENLQFLLQNDWPVVLPCSFASLSRSIAIHDIDCKIVNFRNKCSVILLMTSIVDRWSLLAILWSCTVLVWTPV